VERKMRLLALGCVLIVTGCSQVTVNHHEDELTYSPARDHNGDGTVGFTDLQNTPRASVERGGPRRSAEEEFDEHMDRQDPDWKREHRDVLPR
jgi:hypothetical protein